MGRLAGPIAGALLLLLAVGLVIRYLAFGIGDPAVRDGRDHGPGAERRHIESASLPDALEELGFLHADLAPWVTFHLRQLALSRSAAWLGDGALAADTRTAGLHIAERARAAWKTLPSSEKRLVEAYTQGVNRALATRRVRLAASFVLLDVVPEPWEPWHTLAVERLVVWLQGEPVVAADSVLQRQAGWYGGTWNVAWGGEGGAIMGRYLMGHTATPFLYEVLMDWPGTSMTALTLPGTLMIPMARRETSSGAASWAYLLQPNVSITPSTRPRAGNSTAVTDWVRLTDGRRDTVVAFARPDTSAGRLSLPNNKNVTWPGFTGATDTDQWLALWRGGMEAGAWQLMRADGLYWTSDTGRWTVHGAPETHATTASAVMIAAQPAEHSPAGVLDRFSPFELSTSVYSAEARSGLETMLRALPDSSALPPRARQAVTYLTNWNTRFDASEIGATLYDAIRYDDIWHDPTRHRANNPLRDSTSAAPAEERLVLAMRHVERALGPDMRLWRWSQAHPGQLRWPGWQPPTEAMPRPIRIFMKQYAPVMTRTDGHPTTMVWRQASGAPAVNAWEGLLRSDLSLAYRRLHVPYQQFLAEHTVIHEIYELRRRN